MKQNFKSQPSDIFLCSAPKKGSTWVKDLAFSILTRHKDFTNIPLLNKLPHACIPFLEFCFLSNRKFVDEELTLLPTYLPWTLLPKSY